MAVDANQDSLKVILRITNNNGNMDLDTFYLTFHEGWSALGLNIIPTIQAKSIRIAQSKDGVPYICYISEIPWGKLSVFKLVNNLWESVGVAGFSDTVTNNNYSVGISPNNVPYVSFVSGSAVNYGNITVMKFNGTQWEDVGNRGFAGNTNIISTDINFSDSGYPFVAFTNYDTVSLLLNDVSVMKFNDAVWEYVGTKNLNNGGVQYPSLSFLNGNIPVLAYRDYYNSKRAKVIKFNGSIWEDYGSSQLETNAVIIHLRTAPNGTLYLAYSHEEGGVLKISVYKNNAGNWTIVGKRRFTGDCEARIKLAFSSNSVPYIAYTGEPINKVSSMTFDGTDWVYLGDIGFSHDNGFVGGLSLLPNGIPYVGYVAKPAGATNYLPYILKFNSN